MSVNRLNQVRIKLFQCSIHIKAGSTSMPTSIKFFRQDIYPKLFILRPKTSLDQTISLLNKNSNLHTILGSGIIYKIFSIFRFSPGLKKIGPVNTADANPIL